jgi:hypothetical protein
MRRSLAVRCQLLDGETRRRALVTALRPEHSARPGMWQVTRVRFRKGRQWVEACVSDVMASAGNWSAISEALEPD